MDLDIYDYRETAIKNPPLEVVEYLIGRCRGKGGFIVHTGDPLMPPSLLRALREAGCGPDQKLIVIVQ